MEKYFQLSSGQIHSMYSRSIENAINTLRKNAWKDGTKPQNKQLLAVQTATTELENLFEDYLKPHIQAVRALNYHCPLTTECVNGIQELRKNGIIPLLKKYSPNLGKGIEFARMPVMPESRTEMLNDPMYGVYTKDWVWASVGGKIGKCLMKNINYAGVEPFSASVVDQVGHKGMLLQSNQGQFDHLIAKLKIASKVLPSHPAPSGSIESPTYNVKRSGGYVYFGGDSDANLTSSKPKEDPYSFRWSTPVAYGDPYAPSGGLEALLESDQKEKEVDQKPINSEAVIEKVKESLDEIVQQNKKASSIFEQMHRQAKHTFKPYVPPTKWD